MKVGRITTRTKKINVYDKDGNLLNSYHGFANAARATGVKQQNIYKTCNGYKTLLNGFYFKFDEE
jgi:hypothetical protein